MRGRRITLVAGILCSLVAPPALAAAPAALEARLDAAVRANVVSGAAVGVAVVDVETGELVFRKNAWRRLMPASNEKLYTTVAGFAALGAGFRYETRLATNGTRDGKVLRGNLYLIGDGDPTLVRGQIAALAASIRDRGIRRIQGRVIGDETAFDNRRYGPHWKRAYFGVESPPLSALSVDRNVRDGQWTPEPARNAARLLRAELEARGVRVAQRFVGTGPAPRDAEILGSAQSAPLWRILRYMDHWSDNFMAEMVLKRVGVSAAGHGTTAGGVQAARALLGEYVPEETPKLVLVDGSGLSRANRSTASGLAQLLASVTRDTRVGPGVFGSLPVMGRDGTLRHRPANSAIRAKTGTLTDASSLAGYAVGKSGARYAFAVLVNGHGGLNHWRAHAAQDAVAVAITRAG